MNGTRKAARGFTLIELMITVAIIAVLASVAYPSYTRHIAKGRRAAAEAFMFNVANKQQQYMLNARSFFPIAAATDWGPVGITVPADVSAFYTVTITTTATTFTITATPVEPQRTNDSACGTLTLNSAGQKGQSGSSSTCWG